MGEEVYVDQGEGVVRATVLGVGQRESYEVAFDDGSICTNLPPLDLMVHSHTHTHTNTL